MQDGNDDKGISPQRETQEPQASLFNEHAVFPASLVAQAIRSGPYSTSANAIAELVDNSYDANSSEIHIAMICEKGTKHPSVIAVLDNGMGMDAKHLRHCIQHGKTEERPTNRSRIGRFGVGLLSASFNQCKSLEVYSWTEGLRPENVNCTSLHVNNCPETLPEVVQKPLPDFFEQTFAHFDRDATNLDTHGTLVVWRELDRLTWRTADTLSDKLQREIGRIYRNFLASSEHKLKLVITIAELQGDAIELVKDPIYVAPVDPLFLSSWPCRELEQFATDFKALRQVHEKYNITDEEFVQAMNPVSPPTLFVPFDTENEMDDGYNEDGTPRMAIIQVPNEDGSILGSYRIQASYRRPKIVRAAAAAGSGALRNPGDTVYGKLAERLRGVSILRGGREISLDTNWLRADLTIDRWVSLSIDFDPSLDQVFGISNDKQRAGHLSALAQVNTKQLDTDASEYNVHVLSAAKRIHEVLTSMRNRVNRMDSPSVVQTPLEQRHSDPSHESLQILTDLSETMEIRVEKAPRHIIRGVDDIPINLARLVKAYENTTFEDKNAASIRPKYVQLHDLKLDFATDTVTGGSILFTPKHNSSGAMVIVLNGKHPLYAVLVNLLKSGNDDVATELDPADVKLRLDRAISVIRGLFAAFARAELEASEDSRAIFEEVRQKWSSIAKDFFKIEE